MKTFCYGKRREQKWDAEIPGLVAAVYKETGKQEICLKQRPHELKKEGSGRNACYYRLK